MSKKVFINGHRFDNTIYNELKQDLINYTFGKLSIDDMINKSYEYKGVEVAYIRRKEYESGYYIVIRDILTIEFYTNLWNNKDQYKEMYLNEFIKSLNKRINEE